MRGSDLKIRSITIPGNPAITGDVIFSGPTVSGNTITFSGTSETGSGATTALDNLASVAINAALVLGTSDAFALGSATKMWSDLFLASGALIDFAAGNAVITHSSGILTVSTGDLRVTTAGTNTASAVTVGGTQTLTNKTLTSPRIGTSILDTNGNELFLLTATASAVNEITYANAATGNNPSITLSGNDSNIGLDITPKGTGSVNIRGNSTQSGELRIYEDTDAGTNYASFKVPALSANTAYTLPSDDGDSGQVLSTDGSGVLDWITPSSGGDMKVFINPGVFKINGGSLGTTSTIPFIDFRDGQGDDAYGSCKIPAGATSISAIKIIYTRLSTGNLYLGFYTAAAAYSIGATVQTDSTAEATFAGGASDGTIGIITMTAAAYSGITVAADTILSVGLFRNAVDSTDTYTASWRVLGVIVEFA